MFWCFIIVCFVECLFYLVLVNFFLLFIIVLDFYMLVIGGWKLFDIYVYLVIDGGMYLSYLFGLFYFRLCDFEINLFYEISLNDMFVIRLRKKLKCLKLGIILLYLFLVVFVLLFFNIEVWFYGWF